jgi:hypothetical protein
LSFDFDGAPVLVRSRSPQAISCVARDVAAYHPASCGGGHPACCIDIHVAESGDKGGVALPNNWAELVESTCLSPPEAVAKSDEFMHARWPGAEAFLGPGTVVASLTMETPGRVGLIVAERPSSVYSTPLRTIVEESVVHAHARPDTKSLCRPGSEADVSDLVRVMTIRARGHFCLHAAMLADRGRAVVLMGPSGSGKTTTALALLRGGFYMFSDELSVLHADARPVRMTGFRCEPRIVGDPPAALSELEQTLQSAQKSKSPWRLPAALAPVTGTAWLKPAAMFFLRINPGAGDHSVHKLPPEEAFVRVTDQVLDPTNVFRREEQAHAVISLVEACPAYELVLGRRLGALPDRIRTVLEATF